MRVRQIIVAMCCLALLFGCSSDKKDPVSVSDTDVGDVNYVSDVQPILENNCTRCHSASKSGGDRNGAPLGINLDTYEDAVAHAQRSNSRIQSGTMPPDGGLSETDRAVFDKWVTSGMPRDDDSTEEFVATAENFKGYETWQITDNTIFPTNMALLGSAHQANNSDFTRWIFTTHTETVEGTYPTGTIVLKETFTWKDNQKQFAETGGILAMVKRGKAFNPEGGGWEWFELIPDTLEIAARGGNDMMNGACNACHAEAVDAPVGQDHVFAHPSQYEAAAEDFSDFAEWSLIGEESGASNMLGTAHSPDAVRKIYRRQLANANTVLREYPVGTTLVKQVTDNDQVVELTAMVKRGDAFDPDHGNWEWFMLDPSDLSINGRGASLMDGMCRSCHVQANAPEAGIDHVFAHAADPFTPSEEFIADDGDFAGFKNWEKIDNTIFPTASALLGQAHQANDPNYTRWIYATNPRPSEDDEYPVGTMVVKETFTWSENHQQYAETGGILGMAKRGAGFNPQANDWEWFAIDPATMTIAGRGGADMMDGACNACHSLATGASGTDHVFAHPAEHAASQADFMDYASWTMIGEASGEYDLLQGAHKANTTRRVYKKQLLANPDTAFGQYPVGTTIVKEVLENDEILEITAMVKRGDPFDTEHHNWEWFMLNPADMTLQGRGADLLDGKCNSCHAQALTPDIGMDYVFAHPNDPFNKGSQEFIVADADVADYKTWEITDSTTFPVSRELLGEAHQANNSDFTRQVFATRTTPTDGHYPVGTLIIKETFIWADDQKQFAETGGILGMAKRGENFNPDAGDWEWFALDPNTLEIAARGGPEMMDGICNACHAAATGEDGTDFVFTHPAEYVATQADIANYATWPVIGEESGASTMLGTAHNPESVRRIFRQQLPANPKGEFQQYPTGTIIVKEVTDADQVVELTAMAKRGRNFNPANNDWEWFMLNPEDMAISGRGADLMDGMCGSCHAQADIPGNGADFVFAHDQDPYNNVATTYTKDVLPNIFQKYCLGCHAHFGTYAGAVANAQHANHVIQDGIMPPSGPLSESEKDLFKRWIDAGTPE